MTVPGPGVEILARRLLEVALERPVVLVLATAVTGVLLAGPAAAALLAVLAVGLLRHVRDRRRRRQEAATRSAVRELTAAFAAELQAGQPLHGAWYAATAAPGQRPLGALTDTAVGSAGPPGLLDLARSEPGAAGLRALVAVWRLGINRGVPLGPLLDTLVTGWEEDERARLERDTQLAGARASARLLVAMPAFGLLLSAGIGAQPVRFLLHTPAGWLLLSIGVGLDALGLGWLRRIERASFPAGS